MFLTLKTQKITHREGLPVGVRRREASGQECFHCAGCGQSANMDKSGMRSNTNALGLQIEGNPIYVAQL